jgi:hypothetical protein
MLLASRKPSGNDPATSATSVRRENWSGYDQVLHVWECCWEAHTQLVGNDLCAVRTLA